MHSVTAVPVALPASEVWQLWLPLLACLAVVLVLWASPWLLETLRLYRMMAKLPGPPGLPLVGNLFDVFSLDVDGLPRKLMALCMKYPSLMRLWVTPALPLVILRTPEDIKAILGSPVHVNKASFYHTFRLVVGPGILFHPRKTWKPIRAAVVNSMRKTILSSYVPTFAKNGVEFVDQLERLADEDVTFNITRLCGRVSSASIVDTVFSFDNTEISEPEKRLYVKAMARAERLLMKRIWRPWLRSDLLFSLTKDWKDYNESINYTTNFVKGVVTSKKQRIKEQGPDPAPARGQQSFLDLMLASDVPFDVDLEAEARVLMAAASISSMDTMAFVYYTLAIRQDLQAALHKELDDVFGNDPRPVEDADLPHLGLLERYIKEVLRLFPGFPMFARGLDADVTLPSGHVLPRGCIAMFFLPAVHKDPRYYPNPEELDPDRFLPENSAARHPYTYLAFSAGPRSCAGYRYAMMFLKTQVATVLRRVQILPAPGAPARVQDIPLRTGITSVIPGGAWVRVRRRASQAGPSAA